MGETGKTGVCLPLLGMHRSGTSALTLMLSHLGVSLPAASDLGYGSATNAHNARGFWEPRLLVMENESILRRNGGSWQAPPDLAPSGLRELVGSPSRYQRLLIRYHRALRPWVWKDPRLCLTLDFWDQIIDSRSVVLMFRDPGAVADSLARRDGMPLEHGFALWEWYVACSLEMAASRAAIVVFNSDLVSNPDGVAGRLREWLLHRSLADGGGDFERAVRSIDPSLIGDRASSGGDLPAHIASLWNWIRQLPGEWTRLASAAPTISPLSRNVLAGVRVGEARMAPSRRRVLLSWGGELARRALGRGSSRQLDKVTGVE